MKLEELDLLLLSALQYAGLECHHPTSVVILRYALLRTQTWNGAIEFALCNGGNEEPLVARYYETLRQLALATPYAEGAGDLRSPAGPRYTECWITSAGNDLLNGITNPGGNS